ncbi:MAG: hypothetical protein V1816_19150 [Pseudomonadota bacterium]
MGPTILLCPDFLSWSGRGFNTRLAEVLTAAGFRVLPPRGLVPPDESLNPLEAVLKFLAETDLVVAIFDPGELDPVIWFLLGAAFARGVPVLVMKADFGRRGAFKSEGVDFLMKHGVQTVTASSDNVFEDARRAVENFFQGERRS